MSATEGTSKDLVVLVPDDGYVKVLANMLARPDALGIRPVRVDIEFHAHRDPGCLRESADFLRRYHTVHDHALVCFDRDGCGKEKLEPQELEQRVERQLARNGWDARAEVVVVDPELEAWVWADSPHVAACLGWSKQRQGLREWLAQEGLWRRSRNKPSDPKEAFQAALRKVRKRKSNAIFGELAGRVHFDGCTDRAFCKLRRILRRWFPAH